MSARNIVAQAITKAKLKEVLTKNLNSGVKKMQNKILKRKQNKKDANYKQAKINGERKEIVKQTVNRIIKGIIWEGRSKKNLTKRIPTSVVPIQFRPSSYTPLVVVKRNKKPVNFRATSWK